MAQSILVASPTEDFPQPFFDVIDAEVNRVCRYTDEALYLATTCAHESPESCAGACDGEPCHAKATVHDLAREQEFCWKHFWEGNRG